MMHTYTKILHIKVICLNNCGYSRSDVYSTLVWLLCRDECTGKYNGIEHIRYGMIYNFVWFKYEIFRYFLCYIYNVLVTGRNKIRNYRMVKKQTYTVIS